MPSAETDWAAWMREANEGNAAAYHRLLAALAPHIRAVARARCRIVNLPESEAEDIVQEVLLAIHLKRATWDPALPLTPWVGAITRNKLIDVLRRRGRAAAIPIEDVIETLATEDTTPSFAAQDVAVMLGALKPRQRDIVQAISLDGASIQATATRLNMSQVAVRVSLHRALKSLGALYGRSRP